MFTSTGCAVVDWIHLAQEIKNPVTGSCETSDCIKGGRFLGQVGDYELRRKDSVP